MEVCILVFHLPKKMNNTDLGKFMKKFYGQDSTSWKGKYTYHRHGLLENIPHRKLLRGVLILRNEDAPKVLEFLGQYSLTLHVREIKLTPDDEKTLGETHE